MSSERPRGLLGLCELEEDSVPDIREEIPFYDARTVLVYSVNMATSKHWNVCMVHLYQDSYLRSRHCE